MQSTNLHVILKEVTSLFNHLVSDIVCNYTSIFVHSS